MKEIIFLLFVTVSTPAPKFDSTKVVFIKSAIPAYPVIVASKDSTYLKRWVQINNCRDCLFLDFRKPIAVKIGRK